MQEQGISKKVRLIMAAAAVGLLGIVFILMLLQSRVQEKWATESQLRKVPALGPVDARPLTPEFTATDLSGNKIDLKELKGKVIYINFWAEWCEPCRRELPIIEELQKKYGSKGFLSILINMDHSDESQEKAKEMKRKLAPSAVAVFENAEMFQELFLVDALPFHILVDREGRTAASFYAALDKHNQKFEDMIASLLKEN